MAAGLAHKPFLIAMLFLSLSDVFAQTDELPAAESSIAKMSEYVGTKLAVSNDVESFTVKFPTGKYELYPNVSTLSYLHFNFRAISFAYKFTPNFIPGNNDDDLKGKTTSHGFSFGVNHAHWTSEISFTRTKGYFLNNTSDYVPGWQPSDPYTQLPKLETSIVVVNLGYIANTNFSSAAILTQTERQLKSTGTFLPKFGFRVFNVNDKSGGPSSQNSRNIQFSLGPGYYYTYVFRKSFYLSAGATPSFGYMFTRFDTNTVGSTVRTKQHEPVFVADGRLGVGYNGERFFAGSYLIGYYSTYQQQNTTTINVHSRLLYQVFVGYRFTAPKFLVRPYDWVMRRSPTFH